MGLVLYGESIRPIRLRESRVVSITPSPHISTMSVPPATDLKRWRLTSTNGRQTWSYREEGEGERGHSFVEETALGLAQVAITVLP